MNDEIPSEKTWPPAIDARFGFVLEPAADDPWALSLWWMEDAGELALLYGWAIARPRLDARWLTADVKDRNVKLFKRITVGGTYASIKAILAGLCRGETLATAALAAGLAPPAGTPGLSLCLALGDERVDGAYAPSPWMFLPIGDDLGLRSSHARPRASPNPDAPAIGTALILRDKETLASRAAFLPRGRLTSIIEALEAETGLPFTGEALERLGDIEVFLFPAAHVDESPRVNVTLRSRSPVVTIDAPAPSELMVRCRQELAGLILADEMRHVEAPEGKTELNFERAADGPHVTTVEVWGKRGEGAAGPGLWFRHSVAPIRRMGLSMNLIGTDDLLESDWLAKWAHTPVQRDAVAKMRRIRRTHDARTTEVGDRDAPFIEAARDARAWALKARPPASGGKLFERGDRVAFASWLRDELGRGQGSRVVLIDPFFDAWGVELFARVENASSTFEVVTALRRKDVDEADDTSATEAETATLLQLREACAQLDMMLRGLQLRITGLRGKRPFHDRILLVVDGNQSPVRGYHLSNSLSGAASHHPLLVTVIGDDLLPAVGEYVKSLIPLDEQAREVILDLRATPPRSVPAREEPPTLSATELAERLLVADDGGRAEAWAAFATGLAHTSEPEEPLKALASKAPESFLAWLEQWLSTVASKIAPPLGVGNMPASRERISILTPYEKPFAEIASRASHYFDHYDERGGPGWSVRYGFYFLATFAPLRFVSTIDAIVSAIPSGAEGTFEQRAPSGALLVAATACIVDELSLKPSAGLLGALLVAKTDFLRALGAAAVGGAALQERSDARMPIGAALDLVDGLKNEEERLIALAEWIGDLRVRGNQRGRTEDDASRDLRRQLMTRLVAWWPKASAPQLLRDVVQRAEGPLPGGWADSTTNDFLSLLVDARKLEHADVRRVWLDLLAERMADSSERAYFYASSDSPLTQVVAQLLARHGTADELAPFTKVLERARRGVTRPFARAQYGRWANARDRVLWAEAFARLVAHAALTVGPESVLRGPALEMLAAAKAALAYVPDEKLGIEDPTGLVPFVRTVRKQTAALDDV